MNLLRILTWLLVIWIFWSMLKNYLAKETRKKPGKPALPQKMVKCDHCSVHTPEADALFHDSRWFCNRAHMQAWLGHKSVSDK